MFEDEDFDSELLGAAQRNRNLKAVEATRKEIAGLRADIKRKEAKEKAAPKCPYCSGAISAGAVKCPHCASDIKWYLVHGQSFQLRADENVEHFVAQKTQEITLREERRRTEKGYEATRTLNRKSKSETPLSVLSFICLLITIGGFVITYINFNGMGWITQFISINFIILFIVLTIHMFKAASERLDDNERLVRRKKQAMLDLKRLKTAETSLSVTGTPINCPICDQETRIVYFPYEQMTLCEHCSESFVIPASENLCP